MAGLQGLTGLTGLTPTVVPTVVDDSGATAPEIHGQPVNPVHGQAQWDNPVPWAIQQGLFLDNQPSPGTGAGLLGETPAAMPQGHDPEGYSDPTSTFSHRAPYPGILETTGAVNNREATAAQSQVNQEVHSFDSGEAREFTHIEPPTDYKMPWENVPEYVSSGAADGTPVGGLTGNNRTGWDRYAGWAVPGENINRFGMDSAHVIRFTPAPGAQVPVPLDTTQGHQRPMVMNIPGRYGSYPVGQGSPFYGQLPGTGNDIGAAEIGVASDYQPPPDVPTNPPLMQGAGSAPAWGVSFLGY